MGGAWQEFEEQRRGQTGALILVGAVAALAFLAFLHFYGDEQKSPTPPTQGDAKSAGPDEKTAWSEPKLEIESVTEVEPARPMQAPVASGRQTVIGVYECTVKGQRVLSDHPCGPDARTRTVTVDQPDPLEVARAQQRTWAAQQESPSSIRSATPRAMSGETSGSSVATAPDTTGACAQVDAQIEALNARMRQGYTSQQGEWLRAEWHDLQNRRDALKCGR